jgi:hypothetical protein
MCFNLSLLHLLEMLVLACQPTLISFIIKMARSEASNWSTPTSTCASGAWNHTVPILPAPTSLATSSLHHAGLIEVIEITILSSASMCNVAGSQPTLVAQNS